MKVVLAVDGSEQSRNAAYLLRDCPLPQGTTVDIVSCFEPLHFENYVIPERDFERMTEYNQKAQHQLEKVLEDFQGILKDRYQVRTQIIEGKPTSRLVSYVNEKNYDLCAVGCRGLNPVKRFFLGSVSEKLLKTAKCSVLISKYHPRPDHKLNITCALDGSTDALKAIDQLKTWDVKQLQSVGFISASELRYHYGMAEAIRVSDAWSNYHQSIDRMLEEEKNKVAATMGSSIEVFHLNTVGDAADAIAVHAEEHKTDLVMTGYSHKSGFENFYIGSFTLKFARHGHCSLWVEK